MFKFWHLLGFIWVLPISVLGWIVFGLLRIFQQIEAVAAYPDLCFVWDVKNGSWFAKKFFVKWYGCSIGNNILVIDEEDLQKSMRSLFHENRHVKQQYICGIFFLILYVLESLRIWLFSKDEHAYLDNWFEIDARTYAGQPAKLGKEYWPDGKNDRWPWW